MGGVLPTGNRRCIDVYGCLSGVSRARKGRFAAEAV